MTRSKLRKNRRENLTVSDALKRGVPIAGAMLAGAGVAQAQQPANPEEQNNGGLEEVVVSAQKITQNLQDVPLSIQAIGEKQLAELKVAEFGDYVKFLPSVSYQSAGPGLSRPYMRGVASGENANHSGPLPSVGVYLDEQPITTIQGPLDLEVYDIARVEVLAGPQGTLYGASSQAGTIRIITNKPNPDAFDAGYELGADTSAGDFGFNTDGFVNIPLSDRAAIRLVGWRRDEPGYIDNVRSTRVFPTSGIAVDNTNRLADDYNTSSKQGARAMLRFDINDRWTVEPSVIIQDTKAGGVFAFDRTVGPLKVAHALPEGERDSFTQAALTVQGKIGNWDLTYAGAHLSRAMHTNSDYADYAFFYDTCCGYGSSMYDNDGTLIDPSQFIVGSDKYRKDSHELRVTSPTENRWHAVVGLFKQHQGHAIRQAYQVANLFDDFEVPGNPDTLWLTDQQRYDRDEAAFGEFTWDFTDKLSVTTGVRFFKSDNSLKGFFGFGAGFSSHTGESQCFDQTDFRTAPCIDLDKDTKESGNTKKVNVTYHVTDDAMLYATWSEGFRPGGINRRGTLAPYKSDFLTNYEIGYKTTWLNNRLRFNGALFREDWKDFQYSFLGANGLTEIENAGQARINGFEGDLTWAVSDSFTLSNSWSLIDAKTTADYCGTVYGGDNNDGSAPYVQPDDPLFGQPVLNCSDPLAPRGTIVQAPAGQRLPVQPKFKTNLVARDEFPVGGFRGHVQLAAVYQSDAWSDLRTAEREQLGVQPSFALFDVSAGIEKEGWGVELYVKNATNKITEIARYAECGNYQPLTDPTNSVPLCGQEPYVVTNPPRTIGFTFVKTF